MFFFGRKSKKPTLNRVLCRSKAGEIVNLPWGRVEWCVSKALHDSTKMSFARVVIKAGEADAQHRHPNCDEILHVLTGRIEQFLDQESFTLEAGDTISIPTGVWHHTETLGHECAELICCFSSAERKTEFDATAHVVHQRA